MGYEKMIIISQTCAIWASDIASLQVLTNGRTRVYLKKSRNDYIDTDIDIVKIAAQINQGCTTCTQ